MGQFVLPDIFRCAILRSGNLPVSDLEGRSQTESDADGLTRLDTEGNVTLIFEPSMVHMPAASPVQTLDLPPSVTLMSTTPQVHMFQGAGTDPLLVPPLSTNVDPAEPSSTDATPEPLPNDVLISSVPQPTGQTDGPSQVPGGPPLVDGPVTEEPLSDINQGATNSSASPPHSNRL